MRITSEISVNDATISEHSLGSLMGIFIGGQKNIGYNKTENKILVTHIKDLKLIYKIYLYRN